MYVPINLIKNDFHCGFSFKRLPILGFEFNVLIYMYFIVLFSRLIMSGTTFTCVASTTTSTKNSWPPFSSPTAPCSSLKLMKRKTLASLI